MNIATVAIGETYEIEAQRLQRSVPYQINQFDKKSNLYRRVHEKQLIDGLYHKSNFANYLPDLHGPVIFMDADMFAVKPFPFDSWEVNNDADIAFAPYSGKWYYPDQVRQRAFSHFGYKINSGFIYFKNIHVARSVCDKWSVAYLDRVKDYYIEGRFAHESEYDEYALMIALMGMNLNIQILDKKWNDWELSTKEEIMASDSIFFQSHDHLDIV
jgi:hypothetical protein